MTTYIIKSWTNYGEVIHCINAEDEQEARKIADKREDVWDFYEIEILDTQTKGVVFIGGGDVG